MEMPRNQVQEHDDEADLSEALEDGDNCKDGGLPIQENLFCNNAWFLQHFEQPHEVLHGNSEDSHPTKWWGSVFPPRGISTALSLKKMDFQGQMRQGGFGLQSTEVMRAKRRKGEQIIGIHGGGLTVHPTGRKDRHSKVCTARGITRDRRVRLSPTTAIQFYDVQDRLGYDRPSKAIDWLMKEAKAAIESLDGEAKIQQIDTAERGQVLKYKLEKIGRHDPLNDKKLISRFSFLGDQAYPGDDFNSEGTLLPSTYPSQIWDTNFDLERFQKSVTWNCNNNAHSGNDPGEETELFTRNLPLHFSAPPVLISPNHTFFQREPLQSSVIDYPASRPELPGMTYDHVHEGFSYYTSENEHEVDMNPVPGKPFYAATFLHHQG
ncbi:uncharacterized protein [Henckelia pumila]|uniref:uncharacterized protein n=1 Tax=Henckelia pumila TaxID=405737 RepID=UPI003C6E4C4E